VSQASLLSDELVGQLVAVGQVDVLVGVPTLDNAGTVGRVVRAIHASFATDFKRERTVLINCDGGSRDGTPDVVRGASLRDDETLVAVDSLRTIHRITTPYRGVPGKGAAVRTLFAAAELLQARAVAVFDPDLASLSPDWLARLARPVYEGKVDFVAPLFARHPLEGPLVTQLVRPLVGAAYGHRLHDPVAGEFACSGAFAARALAAADAWEGPLGRYGVELWLPLEALAGGLRVAQAPLGPRLTAAGPKRPSLPEVFAQIVGPLFACLERHESYWTSRRGSEPVWTLGETPAPTGPAPDTSPEPMLESFRAGVRDLAPLLQQILAGPTWTEVERMAADGARPGYGDDLWAASAWQAARAHRFGLMHRDHLVRALVPLYLGRAGAFLLECAGKEAAAVEARLEELERRFEAAKPDLVRTWTPETREVSHG
jgi:hypothetical protein